MCETPSEDSDEDNRNPITCIVYPEHFSSFGIFDVAHCSVLIADQSIYWICSNTRQIPYKAIVFRLMNCSLNTSHARIVKMNHPEFVINIIWTSRNLFSLALSCRSTFSVVVFVVVVEIFIKQSARQTATTTTTAISKSSTVRNLFTSQRKREKIGTRKILSFTHTEYSHYSTCPTTYQKWIKIEKNSVWIPASRKSRPHEHNTMDTKWGNIYSCTQN